MADMRKFQPQITAKPIGPQIMRRPRAVLPPMSAEEKADFAELGIKLPAGEIAKAATATPATGGIGSTGDLWRAMRENTDKLEELRRLIYLQTLVTTPMPITGVAPSITARVLITAAGYFPLYTNQRTVPVAVQILGELFTNGFQVRIALSADNSNEQMVAAIGNTGLSPSYGAKSAGPIILKPKQALFIAAVDFANFPPAPAPATADVFRIREWVLDELASRAMFTKVM